jgi:hypothetical protein
MWRFRLTLDLVVFLMSDDDERWIWTGTVHNDLPVCCCKDDE